MGNAHRKKINESGCENVSTKQMFSKKATTLFQHMKGLSKEELPYYHLGALVDATNGKTFLIKEANYLLEEEQLKQTNSFAVKYRDVPDTELPLSQIMP